MDHTFLYLSLLYLQKTATWERKCEVYCAGKGRSCRILLLHETQRSRYSLFILCVSGSFTIKYGNHIGNNNIKCGNNAEIKRKYG